MIGEAASKRIVLTAHDAVGGAGALLALGAVHTHAAALGLLHVAAHAALKAAADIVLVAHGC